MWKNTIEILIISTVKTNQYWKFNDFAVNKRYLFHHEFHIFSHYSLFYVHCVFQFLFVFEPVQISLQMSCTNSVFLFDQILCLCMQFIDRWFCISFRRHICFGWNEITIESIFWYKCLNTVTVITDNLCVVWKMFSVLIQYLIVFPSKNTDFKQYMFMFVRRNYNYKGNLN